MSPHGLEGGEVAGTRRGAKAVRLTKQFLEVVRRGGPRFETEQQQPDRFQVFPVFDLEGGQQARANVVHTLYLPTASWSCRPRMLRCASAFSSCAVAVADCSVAWRMSFIPCVT